MPITRQHSLLRQRPASGIEKNLFEHWLSNYPVERRDGKSKERVRVLRVESSCEPRPDGLSMTLILSHCSALECFIRDASRVSQTAQMRRNKHLRHATPYSKGKRLRNGAPG